MKVQPYPEQVDCVWFASDRDGHLSAFITAGMGPIPIAALNCAHIAVEDIESRLCELPQVSQAQLLVSVQRPDDLIDLAERGIYVYDWTDIQRTQSEYLGVYKLVAIPTKPITASSMPADLATIAQDVQLADVLFAMSNTVDIRAHLSCVEIK